MAQLIETRWKRGGTDRVFVQTPDGDEIGQLDLISGTVVARSPDFDDELQRRLARWVQAAQRDDQ